MTRTRRPAAERFWPKVDKTETCWNWTGARQAAGYGRFAVEPGVLILVHRWAYETLAGPIPDGMTLDHVPPRRPTHRDCRICRRDAYDKRMAARRTAA